MSRRRPVAGLHKDLAREIKGLARDGWDVERSRHVLLTPPGGGERVIVPSTPHNPGLALLQLRLAVRRSGR